LRTLRGENPDPVGAVAVQLKLRPPEDDSFCESAEVGEGSLHCVAVFARREHSHFGRDDDDEKTPPGKAPAADGGRYTGWERWNKAQVNGEAFEQLADLKIGHYKSAR
jgi:hypothetical protein